MGQARALAKRRDTSKPVLYLLAGPNGAGKTTLYRALVLTGTIAASAEFVNADLYEAAHLQHITEPQARSQQAQRWADARRTHGRGAVQERLDARVGATLASMGTAHT